jgi:LPS sulfotransferase NodH
MSQALFQLFEDSTQLFAQPLGAGEVDWLALGVKQKYIIFMTGRCGSTWLTHLLADSGLCGRPEELFNEEFVKYYMQKNQLTTLGQYVRHAARHHSHNSRFGMEINPLRFNWVSRITKFDECFVDNDTVCFWMTRRDCLSQAYSFATAKQTGRWHVMSDVSKPVGDVEEAVTDRALWREIFLILEQEAYMIAAFSRLGITPIPLTYEELVTDKYSVVMGVMSALGIEWNAIEAYLPKIDDKTRQLQYDKKNAILGSFVARNWKAWEPILKHREAPPLDEVRALLREDHGITIGPLKAWLESDANVVANDRSARLAT